VKPFTVPQLGKAKVRTLVAHSSHKYVGSTSL